MEETITERRMATMVAVEITIIETVRVENLISMAVASSVNPITLVRVAKAARSMVKFISLVRNVVGIVATQNILPNTMLLRIMQIFLCLKHIPLS